MIIDAHTHVWECWPDATADPGQGVAEQLIHAMDSAGVDQAIVVCTAKGQNLDNNSYVFQSAKRFPGRLIPFADVDSFWAPTHQQQGGAARLRDAKSRYPGLCGISHYTDYRTYDRSYWSSPEGNAFFSCAEELGLIISLPVYPREHSSLARLAERHPGLIFLCHHLGGVRRLGDRPDESMRLILASSRMPNIWIKVCGFHHLTARHWEYPFSDQLGWLQQIYEGYGADRLVWGSDFPVCLSGVTYRQSLEVLRIHCPFIPATVLPAILGGNLVDLLARRKRAPAESHQPRNHTAFLRPDENPAGP